MMTLQNDATPKPHVPHVPAAQTEAQTCVHGGRVYQHIGDDFSRMDEVRDLLAADVLDAWYPPAPQVIAHVQGHLEWASHTSPPLHGQGLKSKLSEVRGISGANIILGCGSSDLIFRLVPEFLNGRGPTVIPVPCYGEYGHVLERLYGQAVLPFYTETNDFILDLDALSPYVKKSGAGGVCLVNPCNPTGAGVESAALLAFVSQHPDVRFVIDETYVEYLGADESLERHVSKLSNLMIIKSMSKLYGLSGLRVGYAVVPERMSAHLKQRTPPYIVSTLGQMAAIQALNCPEYYQARLQETHNLRRSLAAALGNIPGIKVLPSVINALLIDLQESSWRAPELVVALAERGLLCRDITSQGLLEPGRYLRIAVLGASDNQRAHDIFREVFRSAPQMSGA